MTKMVWRLPAILAALLALMTYLLVRSTVYDSAQHERIVEALHRVTSDDAALHRDALKARAGLLPNYDPLVQAVRSLREALAALHAVDRIDAQLQEQLRALVQEAAAQEELTESFKSDNAILQNSLSYFTYGIHALGASSRAPLAASSVGAVANAVLRFLRDPQDDAAEEMVTALGRLRALRGLDDPNAEIRSLVAHGEIILRTLPSVDNALTRLLAGGMTTQAQALQKAYLDHHARIERRAKIARLILYAVSVLLLVWLAHVWLRLWRSARALRGRLGFESLVVDISARFVDLPPERAGAGIAQAIARLGLYMAVDRGYALLFDADAARPGTAYSWAQDGSTPAIEAPWRLLPFFEERACDGYAHVPRATGLPIGADRAALEARGITSWLGLSIGHARKRMGLLVFETVRKERHWSKDDIALLRTVSDIFASALERERAEAERKALEARLQHAERMEAIGTLAGGIAHNFNNVLGAILGYGEMALMTLPAGTRPRAHVEQMTAAGIRGKQLVEQILAFGRRGARILRPICVRPVIDEAVALLRASLPATIRIDVRLEADNAAVRGDPAQLQQVVMNLCTNAAQAMGDHGVIELALNVVDLPDMQMLSHGNLAAGRYVRLAVSDAGQGMDATTMERVFEPFFSTKAGSGGTGLGLASVHGIVADHGGGLNVRSRLGEGSTFEAYFPVTDPATVREERVAAPIVYGHGESILVVDDEKPLELLGEEMIAALGYEPIGFDNSLEALAAVRADPRRFDLVLSDEVMPGLSGRQLAAAIHAIRPDIPILLMTGHGNPVTAEQLRAAGIREVLRKPLLVRDIADSIARHLPPLG